MLTAAEPRSPFDAAWQQLAANGYSVLPVAPNSKAPSEYRSGHWYPMKKWEQFRNDPARPFIAKMWAAWPDCNIGIVTGTKATATHMVAAVDYDTDDPDILADLESALPTSPVKKKGRRGYTAFYLVPLRTKGFRTTIVELLTDTRQTVIPPSVHPDTGQPYTWMGPSTLLTTPAHSLPTLTEDDLERFIEQVEVLTKKPVTSPAHQAKLIQLPDDEQKFWRVLNNTAYANLDRWVPDLNLHKCSRTSTGAYKAVAHWRTSSTGRSLSERSANLSIMPGQGARDFGTGDSYTAIDLVLTALSIDLDDAVKFLTTRLGMSEEAVFRAPTLEIETPRNPPEIPVIFEEDEFDPVTGEVYEEAVSAAPVALDQNSFDEIPAHLLHPSGLLGEIMDWIVGGSRRPSRALALGPAIGVVGTLVGNGVTGPTDSATHTYIIGLAPSGAGKDYPLQCIKRLMGAANLKQLLGPSEFISMPSVVNFLQRQPLSICAMDEIGAWLKRLSNKNASGYEASISKILRTIWGISFESYLTPEWAQRASTEVQNPALSLYGVSTIEEFYEGLEGGDIRNGFLNRFLIFSTNKTADDQDPQHGRDVPDDLALKLATLRNTAMQLSPSDLTSPIGAPRSVKKLVWNGGRGPWNDLSAEIKKIREDNSRDPYYARTGEMAVRLATICALGCGRLEVHKEDMQWGRELAMWSARNMENAAVGYMAENENQKVYNRVIRMIETAPNKSLHRRILLQKLRGAVKARDLEELLKSAIDSGVIEETKKIPARGGKPSVVYRVM